MEWSEESKYVRGEFKPMIAKVLGGQGIKNFVGKKAVWGQRNQIGEKKSARREKKR